MEIVANRFEEKEFFLSDLIMTGEVMHEGTEILKAYLEQEDVNKRTCDTGVCREDRDRLGCKGHRRWSRQVQRLRKIDTTRMTGT